MIINKIEKTINFIGIDTRRFVHGFKRWLIQASFTENRFSDLIEKLRKIVPDISEQYSKQYMHIGGFNNYWELKMRAQQAFQCSLMLKALSYFPSGKLSVVDIGDSSGTHMLYLKELVNNRFDIDTISVNLDYVAIEKIKARGLKAIHCRAEDLTLENEQVDLFTSFEMVEHLHNPAIFFRRLAKKTKGNKMVVTVPYRKTSRVGLYSIRDKSTSAISAEDDHIFELNPEDWRLLMLHSGWKIVYSHIYYQYPRRWPFLSQLLAWYLRKIDFEGFWGAILEKDMTFSDFYQDWND